MTHGTYHSLLRISALTFAVLLLFDSGILSPVTNQLSQNTQLYLAQSVGMYAGVEPTELNQLTAKLSQKERELNQRESALAEREIAVQLEKPTAGNSYSTYILSIILFIILVLLVINYMLDFRRMKQDSIVKPSHEKMA